MGRGTRARWAAIAGLLVVGAVLPFACSGPPGSVRPGETWIVVHEDAHAVLRDGVTVATWRLDAEISPPALERHLRADGSDVSVSSVAGVRPYLRPLMSPEDALAYTSLLRLLEIPRSQVPGFGRATPDEGGLSPLFEERVTAFGVEPWPQVEEVDGGFEITRPMMRIGAKGDRLVVLRETVGRDGAYAWEEVRVLAEGDEARGLIFRSR